MCIRTLKNDKGKVVGLRINGTNFKLDRNTCQALSMEERQVQASSKAAMDKIKIAQEELREKVYEGETDDLLVELSFSESKDIITKNGSVEFRNKFEADKATRALHMDLLDHFIRCVNQCNKGHSQDIERKVKGAIKQVA